MKLVAYEVALETIGALRAPVSVLEKTDRGLADQIRRAASSVVLNLQEGRGRMGKDRRQCWRIAAGSAREVRAALEVARAWGHVGADVVGPALALLDRELAMLWRMTEGPSASR